MSDRRDVEFDIKELTERLREMNRRWDMHPKIGTKMEDGSIYAGINLNTNSIIFVMPEDLPAPMVLEKAQAAIKELNNDSMRNLGHDDWQIPDIDDLRIMKKTQNELKLKGTFNAASKHSKVETAKFYMSSTGDWQDRSQVRGLDFTTSNKDDLYFIGRWKDKNKDRMACRPVRIVPYKGVEGPGKFRL